LPKLIDGAYIVVAWVGIKLLVEFAHDMHWIPFAMDRWVSIGVVVALFIGSFLYARAHARSNPQLVGACREAEMLFAPEQAHEEGLSDEKELLEDADLPGPEPHAETDEALRG
ncbi:MAG TPA: hypothetical protein VFU47_14700, partial [Armatimonadota bacterium]|nr:hypothetical protein [Armatimonadota bacterium]